MVWLFLINAVPAVALYLWFKITEKNLRDDWLAMLKDAVASGVATLWLGGSLVKLFEGWPTWIGWFLLAWSIPYWAAAWVAWQKLQAINKGKNVPKPFAKEGAKPEKPPLNRQQRRKAARRR